MSGLDDHRRIAAIQRLPTLPRALFLLHNFYGVDIDAMVQELGADRTQVTACLADARAVVRGHVCYADPVPGVGAAARELGARLQRGFRQSLETAFAECGYPGKVEWPEPSADIAVDEAAAAAFIVAQLPPPLRRAVARSRRADVAAADLWRFAGFWRRVRRRRLLRVTEALGCAGWQRFDQWLADRLVPDHRYPQGYSEHRRRRRPFPEERPMTEAERHGEAISDTVYIPEPLVGQPELIRHVWILFDHYGRSYEEIARLLGISVRRVDHLRRRAVYAILGVPYPSHAEDMSFRLMRMRLSFEWRRDIIRSVFHP